ncbi:MAG: Mce-associated membrane protein [Rhodococcus sp. (in: high G+C Gram-positive bacteria)]
MISNTEVRDSTASGSGPENTGPKNKAKPVLIAASIVAVLALAASVWFGIGWKDAIDDRQMAQTRDSALTGAQQAVLNMTTLDSANLDESFDTILTSVTGEEMNQFIEDMRTSFTEDQRDLSAKTTSELLTGALTELSADDGTAEAVVVVATTTTRDGFDPSRQRLVMEVGMQDVDGTWKASRAAPVGNPVPLNPTADPNAVDPNAVDPNTVDPNATDPNAVDPEAGSDSPPPADATEPEVSEPETPAGP